MFRVFPEWFCEVKLMARWMCRIYLRHGRDPRPFFRHPGGRVGPSKWMISGKRSTKNPRGLIAKATTSPQPGPLLVVYWIAIDCRQSTAGGHQNIIALNVCITPTLNTNYEHFQKYERNKNIILWRWLFPGLLCPGISPPKGDLYRLGSGDCG